MYKLIRLMSSTKSPCLRTSFFFITRTLTLSSILFVHSFSPSYPTLPAPSVFGHPSLSAPVSFVPVQDFAVIQVLQLPVCLTSPRSPTSVVGSAGGSVLLRLQYV